MAARIVLLTQFLDIHAAGVYAIRTIIALSPVTGPGSLTVSPFCNFSPRYRRAGTVGKHWLGFPRKAINYGMRTYTSRENIPWLPLI